MIGFTLSMARSKRYGYAAQHLAECAALAERIEDYRTFEPHATYVARLRQNTAGSRGSGIWSRENEKAHAFH